jgi:hypothetical protein
MMRTITLATLGTLAAALAACDTGKVADEKGNKLTLVAPADQSLKQGETEKVTVAIARKGFEDAVTVRFEGLPAGVKVVETDPLIPPDDNTRTFTLQADAAAELVQDQTATVTASGPGGMSVSEQFKVTVKPAK